MQNITNSTNQRINVADVLRGIAVAGILVLHCIEHFNFYSFPKTESSLLKFTDSVVWDSLFFMFGGKMYAIFSLLFGFSFFIQYDNQQKKGNDFSMRFLWRLFLLLMIGFFNAAFFTGEILVLYALVGVIMIPCSKLSTSILKYLALFFFLQPIEMYRMFSAIFIPGYELPAAMCGKYFSATYQAQMTESFWEMTKANLWDGQLASLTWAWDNGRVTQTAFLFITGILIGRKGLFKESETNIMFWVKMLIITLICFLSLRGLQDILPSYIENTNIRQPLMIAIRMWGNFAFTIIIVSSVIISYYKTSMRGLYDKIKPYGKMSLTNYVTQSIFGSLLFYGWGFALYKYCGHTYSFLIGIVMVILQYMFCVIWLKHHKQGPLEYLWKQMTWINSGKKEKDKITISTLNI